MTGRPGFQVAVERTPEWVSLRVAGDVDLSSIPALELARAKAMEGTPGNLLIDLRGVEFVDSSGLKFLLQTERAARNQGCRLSLLRPHGNAMRVFVITGADQHLPFVDVDQATLTHPIS